jgi:hypothetical protein
VYFCSDEYDMWTSKAKQAATSKARQSAKSFAALLRAARDGPPKMDQGQHDSW